MTLLVVSILAIILAPLALVASRYCSARIRDLRSRAAAAKAFYDSCKPLISDDETPDEVLDSLAFINARITDRAAPSNFVHLLKTGRLAASAVHKSDADQRFAKIQTFFARRPELEEPYDRAITEGLLAMSFNSVCHGGAIRMWLSGIDTPARQEQVVTIYRNSDIDKQHGPRCLAPV